MKIVVCALKRIIKLNPKLSVVYVCRLNTVTKVHADVIRFFFKIKNPREALAITSKRAAYSEYYTTYRVFSLLYFSFLL